MRGSLPNLMSPDSTNDLPMTRGLLMAFSRRRSGYFVTPIPTAVVVGLVTLGVGPLLQVGRRLDRWRRFEWLQFREFAAWLQRRSADPAIPVLAADADRFAAPLGVDWTLCIAAAGSVALVAMAAWHGGLSGALDTAFQPQSLRASALVHSALLSLAWAVVLGRLLQQHARTTAWLAALSASFAASDHRPVAARPLAIPWIGLALASVLAIVGPTWSAAMVATVALQNALIRNMRQARLQLVERMLELTDRSGLPVEFDVEVAEPDAFVTARVA